MRMVEHFGMMKDYPWFMNPLWNLRDSGCRTFEVLSTIADIHMDNPILDWFLFEETSGDVRWYFS